MKRFLVESCLLSHGLVSVSSKEMADAWPEDIDSITWIEDGDIRIGSMAEFVSFRESDKAKRRIDYTELDKVLQEGGSGALTASGTMGVCLKKGAVLAVTCGMGGIGDIYGEELCPDLPALRDLPVKLLATSPKDMLDIDKTVAWLRDAGVSIVGIGSDICTGYIFKSAEVKLDGVFSSAQDLSKEHLLILNGIPEEKRVPDSSLIEKGIAAGKLAESRGEYYHPAVNAAFDELSEGYSSRIQLHSIIENAKLAKKITENIY